jgi:hypothetical protein
MVAIPPVVAGVIAAVSAAASTGVAIAAAATQAQQARTAAQTQRNVAEYNAALAEQQGQIERAKAEDRQRRLIAAGRAAVGTTGLTGEGSALDVMMANVEQSQYDAALLAWNTRVRQQQARISGELGAEVAGAQERAALFEAAGSAVAGAGGIYTAYRRSVLDTHVPGQRPTRDVMMPQSHLYE